VSELLVVEEEEVDVEVAAVDVEVDLAADKREAGAEFAEAVDDPVHERLLELSLGRLTGEVEEVGDGGLLTELLGKVRVRGGKLTREDSRRGTDALARAVYDRINEDVAGPAVLGGSGGVLVAHVSVAKLVQ
jgi:hypothetical protein